MVTELDDYGGYVFSSDVDLYLIVTIHQKFFVVIITIYQQVPAVINTVYQQVLAVINTVCQQALDVINTVYQEVLAVINTVCQQVLAVINTVCQQVFAVTITVYQQVIAVINTVYQQGLAVINTVCQQVLAVINTVCQQVFAVTITVYQQVIAVINTVYQQGLAVINTLCQQVLAIINTLCQQVLAIINTVCQQVLAIINTVCQQVLDVTITKTGSSDRITRIYCCQFLGALIFAIGLTVGLIIGIFVYHGQKKESQSFSLDRQISQCHTRNPIINSDYESSVFAPLTTREMVKAAFSLLNQSIITSLDPATDLTQNFIICMYLHPPEKVKVLNYLDNGGPRVGRYAKVYVQRGAASPPDVMEYKVGPLGSDTPTVTALTQEGEIHFNASSYNTVELTHYDKLVEKDMNILATIIAESFDVAVYLRDLYIFYFNGPPGLKAEERETRVR
ncbi:hypothetical protein CHS0354_031835 [Potamilus streckersoni]|uniref:Copper amine oxidase N2-terminal domain-containing protein n=1 Tax=Potamilus streckersoni TaxID=2493646 RepID=A0AAE0RXN9_9BIVA|nr:hypothetical protein CHS0354_031835 [Potamilus streckersoni]